MRIIVNKPRVSKIILGFYFAILILVIGLFIRELFFVGSLRVFVLLLLGATALVITALVYSILSTRYLIADEELVIRALPIIGGSKRIKIDSIKHVGKTFIPFGFRIFGASFHGGYYYIPGHGRVFMVITNFKDGVIIETNERKFIITPSNPDEFINTLTTIRERLERSS